MQFFRRLSILFIGFATALTFLNWSKTYPVFIDSYYHMAAVEGFRQAGGVVLRDFWSFAPHGRPHIYAPFLHALGYLFTTVGVSPLGYIRVVSWSCYPLSLLLTWLWMRKVGGERTAFIALILLCGPEAWYFNQTAHTANAVALVLALSSFLAFESGRRGTAGVLGVLGVYSHGAGLIIPTYYLLYALHRPSQAKRAITIGVVSMFAYAPWLLHVYASRALVEKASFSGGTVWQLGDFRVYVVLMPLAVLGLVVAYVQRKRMLCVPPLLYSFLVLVPLGYAHRFWLFNSFLPYAALAAVGLDWVWNWAERRWITTSAQPVAACMLVAATLLLDPVVVLNPKGRGAGLARAHGDGGRRMAPESSEKSRPQVKLEMTALPKLVFGGPPGRMELLHMEDNRALFDLIRQNTLPGDVILVRQGAQGSLITAVTGCWTTSGMLREVHSEKRQAGPQDVDFAINQDREFSRIESPFGAPARARERNQWDNKTPTGFVLIAESGGWKLHANPRQSSQDRDIPEPVAGPWLLSILLMCGVGLCLLDTTRAERLLKRPWARPVAAIACIALAACCLLPLLAGAIVEIRNPPTEVEPWAQQGGAGVRQTELGSLHERLRTLVETARVEAREGRDPDAFLPRERGRAIRNLLDEGQLGEAEDLIDRAYEDLNRAGIEPVKQGPPVSRSGQVPFPGDRPLGSTRQLRP